MLRLSDKKATKASLKKENPSDPSLIKKDIMQAMQALKKGMRWSFGMASVRSGLRGEDIGLEKGLKRLFLS